MAHGRSPHHVTSCEKCGVPRPDRAHHCKVCNACVMRMDHHCPWINNCVGIHNHKFFVQLVLYGAAAAAVGVLTSAPWLLFCFSAIRRDDGYAVEPGFSLGEGFSSNLVPFDLSVREAWAMVLDCALGLLVAVLLGLLAFGVVPNLFSNITTIEQNYPRNMNPFDQEGVMANMAQVFGSPGPDWLLPVSPWQPVCDGLVFPARGAPPLHGQAQGEALWHLWYTGGYKGRSPLSLSRPASLGSPPQMAGLSARASPWG
ncbi:unnamed protein product [Prorocentrum cordatum]|uniref:Palmitoyltransferase n=1 Tax=Prorocentrum cordatum TaxID=2364126 RepID=A0ABN9T470_9DINO|nr:unnamed protein product [Polarella glacialis]